MKKNKNKRNNNHKLNLKKCHFYLNIIQILIEIEI